MTQDLHTTTPSASRMSTDAAQPSRRGLLRTTAAGLIAGGIAPLTREPANAQSTRGALGKVLVAYFSRTGNTRDVATRIQRIVGGDLFEIRTTIVYPEAYRATTDQAKREQDDKARPPLAADVEQIDTYDTVFLGYPNWWATMPMVFFTFLERHRLDGKTIVPFCTHEGSRLGSSVSDIKTLCPNAKILDGLALRGGNGGIAKTDAAQREVADWLRRL